MTEDDAKTKWCPFARLLAETYTRQGEFQVSTGYSYNRSPDPDEDRAPYLPDGASCIGSSCMAWRWTAQMATVTSAPDPKRQFVAEKAHYDNHAAWHVEALPAQGHCGLAGSPS